MDLYSQEKSKMIKWIIEGKEIRIETKESLFSPDNIDRGTMAMLELSELKENDKLLDLGCGYGTVGLYAALVKGVRRITMVDINEKAVECSKSNMTAAIGEIEKNKKANSNSCNAQENEYEIIVYISDGLKNVEDRDYTVIMSNPPYHTDFSVPKHFIEDGYKHLVIGGRMIMVTKRRLWYENKLKAVFGGVKIAEKDGYYIFTAEKRERKKPEDSDMQKLKNEGNERKAGKGMSKKLARKYEKRK